MRGCKETDYYARWGVRRINDGGWEKRSGKQKDVAGEENPCRDGDRMLNNETKDVTMTLTLNDRRDCSGKEPRGKKRAHGSRQKRKQDRGRRDRDMWVRGILGLGVASDEKYRH